MLEFNSLFFLIAGMVIGTLLRVLPKWLLTNLFPINDFSFLEDKSSNVRNLIFDPSVESEFEIICNKNKFGEISISTIILGTRENITLLKSAELEKLDDNLYQVSSDRKYNIIIKELV